MLFGMIAPLFAIHSNSSCYFGDLVDLKKLIRLIASFGGTYLQLLPIQDTCGITSPYSLNSWFAIDLRYLYVEGCARKEPLLLHEQIHLKKEKMLTLYHEKKSSPDFINQLKEFRNSHPWVYPYACFKVLKAKFNNLPWWQWEQSHQYPTSEFLESLESSLFDPIYLEIFIQLSCFVQLASAFEEAKKLNISLCCDLPHFCGRDSAEGWSRPDLFISKSTSGAPPDHYSPDGQNWNLSPWNWEGNYVEVLKLWQDRNLLFASYFSHARIDHAIGLFRQWVIGEGNPGSSGVFHPSDLHAALALGTKNFSELKNSSMQLVAENLGTIPPEVNQILTNLQIIGTIVWRWNRYWNSPGAPFIPINQMNTNNLLSLTTHDSSTLEGWAQAEWNDFAFFCKEYSLPFTSNTPMTKPIIQPELRMHIFQLLMSSQCTIKAELIEEFLLVEEGFGYPDPEIQRINDPSNQKRDNWSYRCKVDLETLQESSSWKGKMEKIIACNRS